MKSPWPAMLAALLLIPTSAGATSPAPAPAATDYQAETATISQGLIESNHAGYTGTGFVNYDNQTNSYVQFTVTADVGRTGEPHLPVRQRDNDRPPDDDHGER